MLLEPEVFCQYPVSGNTIAFATALGANIPGLQVFTGSFQALAQGAGSSEIHYKEHPLNAHYEGTQQARDWMFPEVTGYFKSFFAYWKRCKRYL